MTAEFTTVVMTYNLWALHRWPEREAALRAFFGTRDADILAVQELRPETCAVLDELLPRHARIEDEFGGWTRASNIWWRTDLFRLVDFGAEDIGIRKRLRRLFWVKLAPLPLESGVSLLVSTAHYTWPGDSEEESTGFNPRIRQAELTVEALGRLAGRGPCLFMGDLNDHHHPVRVLRGAGFQDCFTALGRSSPVTSPVLPLTRPSDNVSPQDVPKVIDFQFHRGALRVRSAEVGEFFLKQVAPSDHKPVVATYTVYGPEGGAAR